MNAMRLCRNRKQCAHPDGPLLPITEFSPRKSCRDGFAYICKACVREHDRRYYQQKHHGGNPVDMQEIVDAEMDRRRMPRPRGMALEPETQPVRKGALPSFYYPARPVTPKVAPSHYLKALEDLRARVEIMSEDERAVNLLKTWFPTLDDIQYLLNSDLRQRDRVEAVIIFHKRDNRGDSPSLPLIGKILGCTKQSIRRYVKELVDEGRARHECGRYILSEGEYLHPLLRERISQGVSSDTVTVGTLADQSG